MRIETKPDRNIEDDSASKHEDHNQGDDTEAEDDDVNKDEN